MKPGINFSKHSGLGLIELMISMLIGALVLAGVIQMFGTTTRNAVTVSGVSRIQENSRFIFTRIAEDISQTGNLGCLSASTNQVPIGPGAENSVFMQNLLGLASGAGGPYDFSSIVNGDQGATASTDPAGSVALGTDTLRLRYVNHLFRVPLLVGYHDALNTSPPSHIIVDDSDPDYGRLAQYNVVALTNCEQGAIFMITNTPAAGGRIEFNTGVVAPNNGINPGQFNTTNRLDNSRKFPASGGNFKVYNRAYLYGGTTGSFLYFIGTAASAGTNTCALAAGTNSGPQYCALFRRQQGITEELAEGVSNMEVFYGWTDTAGLLFYSRANGVTDWGRVDRVRVKLEFNTVDGVRTDGNTVDTSAAGLISRTVERTFILANQL